MKKEAVYLLTNRKRRWYASRIDVPFAWMCEENMEVYKDAPMVRNPQW